MMIILRRIRVANDVRERRGLAATDARIVSGLNGWSPSAPRNGSPGGCSSFSAQMVKLHKADLAPHDVPEPWKIVIADGTKEAAYGTEGISAAPCGPKAMNADPSPVCREHFVFQNDWFIRIGAQ